MAHGKSSYARRGLGGRRLAVVQEQTGLKMRLCGPINGWFLAITLLRLQVPDRWWGRCLPLNSDFFPVCCGCQPCLVRDGLGGAVHDLLSASCLPPVRCDEAVSHLRKWCAKKLGRSPDSQALVSIVRDRHDYFACSGSGSFVVVNALAESPWGLFTIAATMPIGAVVMGCAMRFGGSGGKWLAGISVFGVFALLAAVWSGQFIHGTTLEGWLTLKATTLARGGSWVMVCSHQSYRCGCCSRREIT